MTTLWRGDAGNIWTDFLAETQHEFFLKIYNNATDYRHYIWTNATLMVCRAPREAPDNPPLWLVQGEAEDIQVLVKDGVADSVYEE